MPLLTLSRALSLGFRSRALRSASMATQSFDIALIQLGNVTSAKEKNLQHAREMVAKAAAGDGSFKPRVVVLPV